MKIIFEEKNMVDHLNQIKEKVDKSFYDQIIHNIGLGIIGCVISYTTFRLTSNILLSFSFFLLICLIRKYIFPLFPSCRLPSIPTPKMFYYEALLDGKVEGMRAEGDSKRCILTLAIRKKDGEKEERRILMKTKIKKNLEEDIVDFEKGIVYISHIQKEKKKTK